MRKGKIGELEKDWTPSRGADRSAYPWTRVLTDFHLRYRPGRRTLDGVREVGERTGEAPGVRKG